MALWDLQTIADGLRRAAFEPDRWPVVLSELSSSVGGGGALLFGGDNRLPGPQASPDQFEMRDDYLRLGWHQHDTRYLGIPFMERHGVMTDLDCVSQAEMRSSLFYQDFLGKRGFAWFAGVGFRAGGDLWCLSIQRTIAQGPFQPSEVRVLKGLWRPFSDAATLSRQLDQARVRGMAEGLEAVGHAALICDETSRIIRLNNRAERLVGPMICPSSKTFRFCDAGSAATFEGLLRTTLRKSLVQATTPVSGTVLDKMGRPLLVRVLSLEGIGPFLAQSGAALILIARQTLAPDNLLASRFRMTPAELQIVKALTAGLSVGEIARSRDVKAESVRAQLKAIYAKTETHSQAQLVALFARAARAGNEGY